LICHKQMLLHQAIKLKLPRFRISGMDKENLTISHER
jgi:hypothetical protein